MQSMTGYGRCQAVLDGREMTLEVKTVNHRFLDLSFRLPRNVGFLEEMLRRELTSGFQRGHMDVFVAYRNTRSDARQVRVDAALAGAYMEAARQVQEIAAAYGISDMNLIKPGIGETTRVLLRRVPWKVLIRKDAQQSAMIQHILRLAEENHVPVEYYPLRNYKTCGLIRSCSDV